MVKFVNRNPDIVKTILREKYKDSIYEHIKGLQKYN